MTTLEIAIEYIARGWAPVPIPPRSKGPVVEEWQKLRMTPDTAPSYFNGKPQNIGVILGEASGGLTDLDLDCQEAIAAAPYLLPRTAIFGHESKRASHFIYKTNLFETHDRAAIKFMSADKLGLLEMRMGGGGYAAQTVFPPSTHVSGEPIKWEGNEKILEIDGSELLRCAEHLAAATELARNYPKIGSRHDAAFALGGFLTGCKSPPPLKLFVEAVGVASGQPREKISDMIRTAANGAECAKPAGFPKLAETFGDGAAKKVADWLGYKGQRDPADRESGWGEEHKLGGASEPQWPQPKPIPAGLPPVDPFDVDFLPASIGPWALDIADRMQCPLDYVGVAALTALGAMIGRKIGVRPKQRDVWTVAPNFWAIEVGAPGTLKSPAIEGALKPLRKIEAEATKAYTKAADHYENELKIYTEMEKDALRKAKKPGGTFRDTCLGDRPEKPTQRRYITSDTTYEKLGMIMSENPFGVMVHRDELMSLVRHLDKEEQCEARAMIMTAWGGNDPYTFDRVARGICHIDHTCLSILGTTQPSVISDYIAGIHKLGAGHGLIQRFSLMTWPEPLPEWRLVDEYPDRGARDDAWDCFERLDALDPSSVTAEIDRYDDLPFLRLSGEGQALFNEWLGNLERFLKTDMPPALQGHFAKYRGLLPKLALVIHLSEKGAKGPIPAPPCKKPNAWFPI